MQVRCGPAELGEYGEAIAVGDRIERPAVRRSGEAFFGTALDDVEWELDRYHALVAAPSFLIVGTVTGIDAVFARIGLGEEGWAPIPGSARLEPVPSTRATRRVAPRTRRPEAPGPAPWGASAPEDGDEHAYGWLLALDEATAVPLVKAV